MNPIIKLSPTNANKIIFTFINYDSDNDNFSNDNDEIIWGKRKEYEFITSSKQNRELIYLLIQFFIIDEKLSITDLVRELDIIKK